MVLPLVVFVLTMAWSAKHPRRLTRLREQSERVRAAVRSGRRAMKQLARSRRKEQRRQLRGRREPPALPPRQRG
jgi:hypothetical protein